MTIYINKKVLLNTIRNFVKAGLDWKEVMRKNLMHEKAHEKYYKWNRKWKAPTADYGCMHACALASIVEKSLMGKRI